MNNEIKEILQKLENASRNALMEMKDTDYQLLLDYIIYLQKENAKVHKELDYADNYNIYLIAKIDKAIEYIEHSNYGIIGRVHSFTKLLNILKGVSNE